MDALIGPLLQQDFYEWKAARRVSCCLIGGGTQHAATAAALDIARTRGARLTALASFDPFDPASPERASPLRDLWRNFRDDIDLGAMREAARRAISDFELQLGRGSGDIVVDRVGAAGVWPRFHSSNAGHDLAVVPAGVGLDGRPETLDEEVAARLASRSNAPVLRVSRRPLAVEQLLLVIDNTPQCRRLARTLTETDLWASARLSILPVGCDRPIVDGIVRTQTEHFDRIGRPGKVRILAPLPLGFEAADIIDLVSGFPAALMGQLSNRVGLLGAARNDIHDVVANTAAMILLPHGRPSSPGFPES